MTWQAFLAAIESCESISLVGPLHGRDHIPTEPTVYVDGGTRFHTPGKTEFPVVSVGDGDSSAMPVHHRLPAKKDFSDLAFVLRALPSNVVQVNLWGFLGGRRDHEILGLGEVHSFLKGRSTFARANFDSVITAIVNGQVTLNIQQRFSLLVFEPTVIELSGHCEFPFAGKLPSVSTLGLSNEGRGTVHLKTAGPCFLLLS